MTTDLEINPAVSAGGLGNFAAVWNSDGFPSPAERLGLMAINRARSDPQTVKGSMSASYPARPPVIYSDPLTHSARFHAVNLEMADVTLMHSSPCPLNTDVATSGASTWPLSPG